ncbi:putative uncharacterized protein DDB_G0287113 [Cheilinus undulatus]|uniref:putative uncharacterized protein DDB_G0287113 n=1 Tax=Cheilinus undulatus TaxID=241271 RepID=UPI001BD3214D|nr:putative uncharacterized protein DDB_G0287113 [Cheilinus undulatus]
MARRKAKKPLTDDTSILLEPSAPQSKRRLSSYTSSALLFITIFVVGVSIMGWFCVWQQQSIEQLSDTFTTMQKRITNFQQVMATTDEQTGSDIEERIMALEKAHKQAQEKAEVAQAASEKLKNSNLFSQILDLHDEMDIRLAEINQVSLSVTTLQGLFKNQSKEFEAVKESVVVGLTSSSELSENVAELTDAVANACSKVDQQVASVEALNAKIQGQASELEGLKDTMDLHKTALHTNNQEIAAIKELIKAEQAMRAQALKEMLNAVQMTLNEQFFTSQTLHSSVMAQLQSFHNQLAHTPSWSLKPKLNEESNAEEGVISSTAQNTTEIQEHTAENEEAEQQDEAEEVAEVAAENVEEEDEAEDAEGDEEEEDEAEDAEGDEEEEEDVAEEDEEEDLAEDEAEEESSEEETEEEQPLDQEAVMDVAEDEEEEEVTEEEMTSEEEEEEDTTGQSGEQEISEETAEEGMTEETVDDDIMEEDNSVEGVASWETLEEEPAELNSDVTMDKTEED